MTFPAGVVARQVTVGPFIGPSGEVITGQVQVECPISLKWLATGDLILNRPESIFLDTSTGTGSITLPIVQIGFANGSTNAPVSTWTYVFTPILEPYTPAISPLVVELGIGDGAPVQVDFNSPNPSTNGAVIYTAGPAGAAGAASTVPGPPNTLTVGTVTTLTPGSAATVAIHGGAPNQSIDFGIPAGQAGTNASAAGVPVGGVAGQVLTKVDSTNFNTSWQNNAAQGIPAGGLINQILAKVDGTDYTTQWVAVPIGLPNGGTTGQYLVKNSGANGDAGWLTLPVDHDLPVGGTTGQVLAKSSNADRVVGWVTPSAGGGGAVASVQGRTGVVVLTPADLPTLYVFPGGGIPQADLAAAVQVLLTAAGTSVQQTDNIVYSRRYSSGAWPVRGSVPSGSSVQWIGPAAPPIDGTYALAGVDTYLVSVS